MILMPTRPCSQARRPQPPCTLVKWDMELWEPEPLVPAQTLAALVAGWLAGLVAERLHGAQGPVVCGEAGTSAEAHVVQGERREAMVQADWEAYFLQDIMAVFTVSSVSRPKMEGKRDRQEERTITYIFVCVHVYIRKKQGQI